MLVCSFFFTSNSINKYIIIIREKKNTKHNEMFRHKPLLFQTPKVKLKVNIIPPWIYRGNEFQIKEKVTLQCISITKNTKKLTT